MTIFQFLCKIFPKSIKNWIKINSNIYDHSIILNKIKVNGFYPNTIIDIGAHQGEFTVLASSTFCNSKVLMVEGNEDYFECLKNISSKHNVFFEGSIVSNSTEPLFFKKCGSGSEVVVNDNYPDVVKVFPKLLDDIFSRYYLKGPVLIKIDVQGHELNVLKGAIEILKVTEVVILEISLIKLGGLAPSPNDIMHFFHFHGFRLFDIFGFNRRPCNHDLWQVDWVFVKEESKLGSVHLGW